MLHNTNKKITIFYDIYKFNYIKIHYIEEKLQYLHDYIKIKITTLTTNYIQNPSH